jgi:hypothetical protein
VRTLLQLTDEITAAVEKLPMCREAWRAYGAALLEQRTVMPSTRAFGAWIKANGLDAR